MRTACLVSLVLAGCTFSTHGVSDDVVADDVVVPDASPIDASEPDAEPDPTCTPGCDGATLIECNGTTEIETDCELGCGTAGAPHCQQLVPSNLTDRADLDGVTGGIAIPAAKINVMTDTGAITTGDGTVIRAAGALIDGTRYRQINADLAILVVDTFSVAPGTALFAFGNRALIVLSRGAIQVEGALDFSAGCDLGGNGYTARCGGPGGGDGGSSAGVDGGGCAGGIGGENGGNENGGAGGGNASMGGNGGIAAGKTTPLATALTTCTGATLIPLKGGSGGGSGAPSGGSVGGGGGGVLQLTSLSSITIGAAGSDERPTFQMSGAGGTGPTTANKAGGGGGAGGGLLLEAPTITIHDLVMIAGGGGGGGGRITGAAANGGWALEDGTPAPGGAGDGAGAGGTGGTPTAVAAPGGGNTDGTGGGGGGIGRLRINDADGNFALGTSMIIDALASFGPVARN